MKTFLIVSALVAVAVAAPQFGYPFVTPYAGHGLVHAAPFIKIEDDGQYRTGHFDRAIDLRGEYQPDAEGQYLADDEGSYKPDEEGAYKPDSEGAYNPGNEGQYDAASAHATEALSENGSYKGEPLHIALSAGIVKAVAPVPVAHAYAAHPYNFGYPYLG
ncbi:hypothetical protein B566_EDAN007734 [Ephemera danica]|nr:hypothetical protein B566_EDAN007734 [Ephemera danica]